MLLGALLQLVLHAAMETVSNTALFLNKIINNNKWSNYNKIGVTLS